MPRILLANLMNHRLREGLRSHSFEKFKIPNLMTMTCVLVLSTVKRVAKLHVDLLKILRTVLPSWVAMSAEHPMPGELATRTSALLAKWCHLATRNSGHAQVSQTLSSGHQNPNVLCRHDWVGPLPKTTMVMPSLHGSVR